MKRIIKWLASLKLAVFSILAIAVISAYGTLVESWYDATTAQKLVYHSWWSYTIFAVFSINLLAVIVDRWPWKMRHICFICAHVGILVLLAGSLVTRYYGIDGSIRFGIGESRDYVTLPDTSINLYASLDGGRFRQIHSEKVDFLVSPPSENQPKIVMLNGSPLKIFRYHPYVLTESKIDVSDQPQAFAAIRFQLENDRVNMTEWLELRKSQNQNEANLGPARVVLSFDDPPGVVSGNVIWVQLGQKKEDSAIKVSVIKNGKLSKPYSVEVGDTIETGWMGLKFRVLKHLPKAQWKTFFTPLERPIPISSSSLEFEYDGKTYQVALNQSVRIFGESQMFVFSFNNQRIPLGFFLTLANFEVGRYQGTNRAATYKSLVQVPVADSEKERLLKQIDQEQLKQQQELTEEDRAVLAMIPKGHENFMNRKKRLAEQGFREVVISMNEPLKHKGFTFYQASFEEDKMGQPTASILSVNHDPGRFLKYLGSCLLVLGSILLFYFKKQFYPKKKSAES